MEIETVVIESRLKLVCTYLFPYGLNLIDGQFVLSEQLCGVLNVRRTQKVVSVEICN